MEGLESEFDLNQHLGELIEENGWEPSNLQRGKKIANGSGNIFFGTLGAIGSGIYIVETAGLGSAAGGATAFTFSIAEISIGIAQIDDAISNGGNNEALQGSSSLPGIIANKNGSENAKLIDAAGQFIPGMLSGGNLKTIAEEAGQILAGKGTLSGTANAIDAVLDTSGLVEAIIDVNSGNSRTNTNNSASSGSNKNSSTSSSTPKLDSRLVKNEKNLFN